MVKTSEIVTAIIAAYGAVLSTFAVARQFMDDRVKVKLALRRNQKIANDPHYHGMTLTIFTVTNVGRRPVTITGFGAIGLYPHVNFAALDSEPQLPCEITEGKYVVSKWDQAGLDFSAIDYWEARDSRGKKHKLREAPWLKHFKSVSQLRQSWKKKA